MVFHIFSISNIAGKTRPMLGLSNSDKKQKYTIKCAHETSVIMKTINVTKIAKTSRKDITVPRPSVHMKRVA